MNKLPISAMVVGYNEAGLLKDCLQSISFCNEIVYTDLGSSDRSIEVASTFANQIYQRDIVPSCEMIQTEVVNYLKNDWILFIDPDEKIDEDLAFQVRQQFDSISKNPAIGAVMVPWQFYFKQKPLRGTVWGGNNSKYLLVHKARFQFLPIVHYGRKLMAGFTVFKIDHNAAHTNLLHHYWMTSYKVFIGKHRRYLKNEGIDNYNQGVRVGKKTVLLTPIKEFKRSFFTQKGYKDGITGFLLSLFWAYYKTYITLDILKIQRRHKAALQFKSGT